MVDFTFRRSPQPPGNGPSKTRGNSQPASEETAGSLLPVELILQIFVELSLFDILQCRIVSPSTCLTMLSIMKADFSRCDALATGMPTIQTNR